MIKHFISILTVLLVFCTTTVQAQITLGNTDFKANYSSPKNYKLGGVTVSGIKNLDKNAIVVLSGLQIGTEITVPGEELSMAIRKLWKQGLFSDVQINVSKIEGNTVFLDIALAEQPRLSRFKFTGVSKSDAEELKENLNLYKERIITQSLIVSTQNKVRDKFVEEGFLDTKVEVELKDDTVFKNRVFMFINVERGKKVRINEILVEGNQAFSDSKVKRQLKETKQKVLFIPFRDFDRLLVDVTKTAFTNRDSVPTILEEYAKDRLVMNLFKASKYLESNFINDKKALIEKYNAKGYRDAKVIGDSTYRVGNDLNLVVQVDEGNQYYFRNIEWIGNSKYTKKQLNDILGIEKGMVYDPSLLESRLYMNPNGRDVSSLYMDDGYLFFSVEPVETYASTDSIDLEIRIREGDQARVNRIIIEGNTKTNDQVVLREIRTKPGELFSRADIIRTQRELSQLGYFDPENMNVTPIPNPSDGTVDIKYTVVERSNDQVELSGGWGAGQIVGNLGLSFNNFSLKNLMKYGFKYLPSGDGQTLNIRASSNGRRFQSVNFSFTEPWLGGKQPNAFSVFASYTILTDGSFKFLRDTISGNETKPLRDIDGNKFINENREFMKIYRVGAGLGRRLKWPDDYFQLYQELTLENYQLQNSTSFIFTDGVSNNFYYNFSLSRNSTDRPIYPMSGSEIKFVAQLTPPYSFLSGRDVTKETNQEKYKWVEYHKWKFATSWYTKIVDKLVLNTRIGFGYLGEYNKNLGSAPFERFYLGGSGLTGFQIDGREIIALRGYDDNSVSPSTGGTIINKYTMELRYPFVLNPSSTIFGLAFVEGGNTWNSFKDYDPFNVKRSAGVGVRIFLPMFGLLGLDWGYRFDDVPTNLNMDRSQIHFTIGANLGEL